MESKKVKAAWNIMFQFNIVQIFLFFVIFSKNPK